eukprot:TRINITY_DN4360_c0_g1_i4.p1 TRINITY_DN4360_c0_g1~~TRINITY_DN4360_c0_g1_i4.p1  ORF type:complete len:233 (-),score=39.11 TRINITY_DN4360_c0_g1_i4:173-871(-)
MCIRDRYYTTSMNFTQFLEGSIQFNNKIPQQLYEQIFLQYGSYENDYPVITMGEFMELFLPQNRQYLEWDTIQASDPYLQELTPSVKQLISLLFERLADKQKSIVSYRQTLPENDAEVLLQIFKTIDINQKGYIKSIDLQQFITQFDGNFHLFDIDLIMQLFCRSSIGRVNFNEFYEVLSKNSALNSAEIPSNTVNQPQVLPIKAIPINQIQTNPANLYIPPGFQKYDFNQQ